VRRRRRLSEAEGRSVADWGEFVARVNNRRAPTRLKADFPPNVNETPCSLRRFTSDRFAFGGLLPSAEILASRFTGPFDGEGLQRIRFHQD